MHINYQGAEHEEDEGTGLPPQPVANLGLPVQDIPP
jgi:hypothetical protein